MAEWFTLYNWLYRLSAVVAISVWWFMSPLPPAEHIESSLLRDPIQLATTKPEFIIRYKDQTSSIQPMAEYGIWGLVVSHNDPDKWYTFNLINDEKSINTRDICIIWGDNLVKGDYQKISFHNSDYQCVFRYGEGVSFNFSKISNNHLISNNDAVRKQIAALQVGDQIYIRGLLVNYSEERWNGWYRNTSLTRNDMNDGACEVIYVQGIKVIRHVDPLRRQVLNAAMLATLIFGIAYFFTRPIDVNR